MTDQPASKSENTADHSVTVGSTKGDLVNSVGFLTLLVVLCLPFIGLAVAVYKIQGEKYHLLYETDHPALLEASRKLMHDYAGQDIDNPSQDPRVPLIIRELGPSYLDISNEYLLVELHGGFDHYGFVALPEGSKEERFGRKIIEGLYYRTD